MGVESVKPTNPRPNEIEDELFGFCVYRLASGEKRRGVALVNHQSVYGIDEGSDAYKLITDLLGKSSGGYPRVQVWVQPGDRSATDSQPRIVAAQSVPELTTDSSW